MAGSGETRRDRRLAALFYGSLAFFVVVVVLFLALLVHRQQSYVFVENGSETYLRTYEKDPMKAMAEAGIELGYRDSFRVTDSGRLHTVEIHRGVCVSLTVDGQMSLVSTSGPCVRDVLEQVGADCIAGDILNCQPGDLVYDGMEITLTTVRYRYVSYEVPTSGGVLYVANPAVPDGEMNVMVPGCTGVDSVVFRDTYVAGVRVLREECGRCTVTDSEMRVVEMGTGQLTGPAIVAADGKVRTPEQQAEVQPETEESAEIKNWSGEGDEGDTNAPGTE